MRLVTAPPSMMMSLAVGVLFAALAAAPAAAQDATEAESAKADSATPAATPAVTAAEESEPSDRERRRQRRREGRAETLYAAPDTPPAEVDCRSITVVGSRMPKRVCATTEEWEAIDAKGEESVREMRRTGNGATMGTVCARTATSPC